MRLYLVRHGEATSEAEDPKRPLSIAGRAEVEKIARHLARVSAIVDGFTVRHSGKLRAAQTAEILAAYLHPAGTPEQAPGLAPGDPPQRALELIQEAAGDLMLAGHLPHLGRLASLLLTGDSERVGFKLPAAAIVCLERESGSWRLNWLLIPALAAG